MPHPSPVFTFFPAPESLLETRNVEGLLELAVLRKCRQGRHVGYCEDLFPKGKVEMRCHFSQERKFAIAVNHLELGCISEDDLQAGTNQ